MRSKITRRRFLGAAAAGSVWITLTGTLGCEQRPRARAIVSPAREEQPWAFLSRPDLRPPAIEVRTQSHGTAPGYVFVAPKKEPGASGPSEDAPLILDDRGQPVWFHPVQGDEEKDAFNFEVQKYKGETVLTWWEGHHTGYGQGEYVICDHSYREIIRVKAGNGYEGDHHEFLITPEDTALITIYSKVPMDLSGIGGPVDGVVLDGIVQELDIETGEVLFEWHSLEHVALEESYWEPKEDQQESFDYFHINSIDVYDDDHLLISGRRTSTVYKVDRKTGEVVWRLGGMKSNFDMGPGTRTDYQHDARHPDGIVTIFDNGNLNKDVQSRGIVLKLDEDAMSATLITEYTHPDKIFSDTQGNVQVLPNGNVFMGWGSEPYFSEFSRDGKLLFDASFPPGLESYRAFRFPWKGQPQDAPAVVAESGPEDKVTLYVSWNGATEVDTWQVLAGAGPDWLVPVGSAPRKGFETALMLQTGEPYIAVEAKDSSGQVLGTSKTLKPGG
ncbi:MAG TPA: arylsulfotransferase family protein [Rubrobacter sp.]|nr:arylsulfotransferase family protein [Rubrobacter sp.]